MVTLGTSVKTFTSVTALGGRNGAKDALEESPGIESSSVHAAMVTSSHPQGCKYLRRRFLYGRDAQLKEASKAYMTPRVF